MTTEQIIWSFLKSKNLTDYAVAGIMGNLQAESNLRSNNLEDTRIGAEYRLLDNLDLNFRIDFVTMRNIFNIGGQNATDVQMILGAKYECF